MMLTVDNAVHYPYGCSHCGSQKGQFLDLGPTASLAPWGGHTYVCMLCAGVAMRLVGAVPKDDHQGVLRELAAKKVTLTEFRRRAREDAQEKTELKARADAHEEEVPRLRARVARLERENAELHRDAEHARGATVAQLQEAFFANGASRDAEPQTTTT
jgi:hypothetical protein